MNSRFPTAIVALLFLLIAGQTLFAATSATKSKLLHLNGQYVRAESSDTGEISIAVFKDIAEKELIARHDSVIKKPEGEVVSLDIAAWKQASCYVVMCLKEKEGIYRYDGIAFDYGDETGRLRLNKGVAGTFFYSQEFYDTIHLNRLDGDSITITFLETEWKQGRMDLKSGVLLFNGCPIIPMPGTLYTLEGKLIYDFAEELRKAGNLNLNDRTVPHIPSPGKK